MQKQFLIWLPEPHFVEPYLQLLNCNELLKELNKKTTFIYSSKISFSNLLKKTISLFKIASRNTHTIIINSPTLSKLIISMIAVKILRKEAFILLNSLELKNITLKSNHFLYKLYIMLINMGSKLLVNFTLEQKIKPEIPLTIPIHPIPNILFISPNSLLANTPTPSLPINPDHKYILVFASEMASYELDEILIIFSSIIEEANDVHLVIVIDGKKKYKSDPAFQNLVRYNKKISNQIHWFIPLNFNDVIGLINTAHLILFYLFEKSQSLHNFDLSLQLCLTLKKKILCNNNRKLGKFKNYIYTSSHDTSSFMIKVIELLVQGGDQREKKYSDKMDRTVIANEFGKIFNS